MYIHDISCPILPRFFVLNTTKTEKRKTEVRTPLVFQRILYVQRTIDKKERPLAGRRQFRGSLCDNNEQTA